MRGQRSRLVCSNMPFLQVLWNPRRFTRPQVNAIRHALMGAVGPLLMEVDPSHVVNEAMVDAQVTAIGSLDAIRSDLFVTLLARREDLRVDGAVQIVARLRSLAIEASGVEDAVVELILTDHTSSVDYAQLE